MKHAIHPLVRATIALLSVCLVPSVSTADTLTLVNGQRVVGTVKRAASGDWLVYGTGGAVYPVRAEQVAAIEIDPPANLTAEQAAERLDGLRRWCQGTHEPAAAIRRYQAFISQIKEPNALAAAKADLATWQDRQQRRMVKLNDAWFDPATDQAQLDDAANAQADRARSMLKAGNRAQAEPLLSEIIDSDSHNGTALYLMALLRIDQSDLPGARRALDALVPLAPNHAPTLNNLAVVQWRQNQFMAALSSYDAAMAAAPGNELIVGNVSAALAAMPVAFRSTMIYAQLQQDFQQQQAQLTDRMAKAGLVRFGSIWIPLAQRQQIESQQKQAREQLNQLAAAFDVISKAMEQTDQDILQTQNSLHRMLADAYLHYNPYGLAPMALPIYSPPPMAYTNLQQDLQLQQQRRQQQYAALMQIRKNAVDLQRQLGPPPIDLTQYLVGIEGTPFFAASPTTQPQ